MPAIDVNGIPASEARPYHVLITGFGVSYLGASVSLTLSNARLTVSEPSRSLAMRSIHHGWPSSHSTTPF
jgi:hypothetical protein